MKKICSILITLSVLTFFHASWSHISEGAVLLDRVVATVNDEVITWSELDRTRQEKISDLEGPFLKNLIEMKLQLQEARRMGLDVGDAEIDSAVSDIRKKFDLDDETFLESLKAEGLTMQDYRTRLGEQILLSKVVNFAVRNNIVISEKNIDEYYRANEEQFDGRERLKIRQIFFTGQKESDQARAIEKKGREVLYKLKRGEDFAKLAKEFSEDSSRDFGGDLGYITRGSALKEIEDAAYTLKIGEVSKPFWSEAGLHIIKLEDRISGSSIVKVKDKITEILFQKSFDEKYHEWKTGLRERSYIETKL
jgi:peptidyl-prolyl cis-trans isomerase SurA